MASNETPKLSHDYECGKCGAKIPSGTPLNGAGIHWNKDSRRWNHDQCLPSAAAQKAVAEGTQHQLPAAEASARPAVHTPPAPSGATSLANLPEPELMARYGCTRQQFDLVRKHIAPRLDDTELDYYLSVAKSRGLSPWARQVYASKYKSRTPGKPDTLVLITGIDGLRQIAHRGNLCDGIEEAEFGPDVDSDGIVHPEWAKVRVWRKGSSHPFVGVARWTEYRKMERDDRGRPTLSPFWRDMPHGQLEKCAEGRAIRRAFPEAAGLYTSEEMDQATSVDRELPAPVVDVESHEVSPTPSPPTSETVTPPVPSLTGERPTPEGAASLPVGGPQARNLEEEVPSRQLEHSDPAVQELVHGIRAMLNPAGNKALGERRAAYLPVFLRVEHLESLETAGPGDVEKLDRIETLLRDVR